jgi:hypothetical protein
MATGPVAVVVVGAAGAAVGFAPAVHAHRATATTIRQAPRRTVTNYRVVVEAWLETGPVPTLLDAATS